MSDDQTLPNTLAFHKERQKLPRELQDVYDSLVLSYRFFANIHHNHPFVSYKILADLVRDGWRPAAEPSGRDS